MKKYCILLVMMLVFSVGLLAIQSVSADSPDGLVAHWKFDEGVGNVALDETANDNDGTLSGGRFGGCLEFDGINDYLEVPDSGELDVIGPITIEAWIKPYSIPSTGDCMILSKYNHYTDERSYLLHIRDGLLSLSLSSLGTNYDIASAGDMTGYVGEWVHVAGTLDGADNFHLYINGNEQTVSVTTSGIYESTSPLYIGAYLPTDLRPFDGQIDEVRISDVAISSFDLENPPDTTDAVALWHFDEGSGQTAYDSAGTNDAQLGPTTGTDVNDPTWIVPGPTWTTGLFGSALNFDGVDDYVQVPHSATLDLTSQITVEAYIKMDSVGGTIMRKGAYPITDPAPTWGFDIQGGKLRAFIYDEDTAYIASGSTTLATDTWYHIAFTYDGATVRLYLDGVEDGSQAHIGDIDSSDSPVWISKKDGVDYFNGIIDEPRIWNQALVPITFDYTGLDSSATGELIVTINDPILLNYEDLPHLMWIPSGAEITYEYEEIVASSDAGKAFTLLDVTGPASPFTVTEPTTVTGNYFKWVTLEGKKYVSIDGTQTTGTSLNGWTILLSRFCDDFEDGNDDGWSELSGDWEVIDDSGDYVYSGTATSDEQLTYALSAGIYSDFTIEADVKAVNNVGHYGLVLREDGSGNHYGFYLNAYPPSEGKYWFGYWDGSYNTIIPWTDSGGAYTDANTWNNLKVEANGYEFKLYINDVLVNTVTDVAEYAASGYAGLLIDHYSSSYQNTYFDDFCIYDTTITADIDSSTGKYIFDIKKPGTYILKEEVKEGWTQIYPDIGYYELIITGENAGSTIVKCFWNFEWATISGTKYDMGEGFCDDFESYEPESDGSPIWAADTGNWTVVDSLEVDHNQVYYGKMEGRAFSDIDVETDSMIIRSDFKALDSSSPTGWANGFIIFDYQDPDNFKRAGLGVGDPRYIIDSFVGGTRDEWKEIAAPGIVRETWYNLMVEIDGDTVYLYVDGVLKADYTYTGSSIGNGKIGVQTGTAESYFDNFCFRPKTESLEGWTFNLYDEYDPQVDSDTTGSDGQYELIAKYPGTYYIYEDVKDGWTLVYPDNVPDQYGSGEYLGYGVTVESGDMLTGYDFWNFKWVTVSGYKYFDADGDGEYDEGEPGLQCWDINLEGVGSTQTNSDGYYEFEIRDPGIYTLSEEQKTGCWMQTSPEEPGTYTIATSAIGWDISGDWILDFDHLGSHYIHDMIVTDNTFVGTGGYPSGGPYSITWTVTGTINGNDISMTIDYDSSSYYVDAIGTIASDGTMSGTWSNPTQSGTWTTNYGEAIWGITRLDFGNWLGPSIVTTSGLCCFDKEPGSTDTREFRLIFTPDTNFYKISSSNPGQFYYNVFYVGTLEEGDEFLINIPYPFVTQGANPVHVYSSLNTDCCHGCLVTDPDSEITGDFEIDPAEITLGGKYNEFGDTETISVEYTNSEAYDGFIYITIHLDYGLKKTDGYNKNCDDDALHLNGKNVDYTIENRHGYMFSVDYPEGYTYDAHEDTIYNLNCFKKFAGFMGLITYGESEEAVAGQAVCIKIGTEECYTVDTDEDGCYMLAYKHTGKRIGYEIYLGDCDTGTKIGEGLLKANGFVMYSYNIEPTVLESAAYKGTGDTFGDVGDTMTFTFSDDIAYIGTGDIKVYFEVALRLSTEWGKTDWDLTTNSIILTVTATDTFSTPRDYVGDKVTGFMGIVDAYGLPVVVLSGGVEVEHAS